MGVRYLVYCFTGGFTMFDLLAVFGGRGQIRAQDVIPLLRMSNHDQWTILIGVPERVIAIMNESEFFLSGDAKLPLLE